MFPVWSYLIARFAGSKVTKKGGVKTDSPFDNGGSFWGLPLYPFPGLRFPTLYLHNVRAYSLCINLDPIKAFLLCQILILNTSRRYIIGLLLLVIIILLGVLGILLLLLLGFYIEGVFVLNIGY